MAPEEIKDNGERKKKDDRKSSGNEPSAFKETKSREEEWNLAGKKVEEKAKE
jgi:hypothetical protein